MPAVLERARADAVAYAARRDAERDAIAHTASGKRDVGTFPSVVQRICDTYIALVYRTFSSLLDRRRIDR